MMFIFSSIADFVASGVATVSPLCWIFVPYWAVILSLLCLSPLTVVLPQLLKGSLDFPSEFSVPEEWIIHGKRYNLTPFFDMHPGGKWVLRAAKGSDCTGLFESYHLFIEREVLFKMLARYEIKDGSGKPPPPDREFADPFYLDLKAAVREYFRGKGKGAHKMTWPRLSACAVAWCTMWILVYLLIAKDATWTIVVIGVLSWYLTGNVMHDASHSALVTKPWLNKVLCHAAFPYGVNTKGWHIQHVMSHHVYTNEEDDVDLHHFEPVMVFNEGRGKIHPILHGLRLLYLFSSAVPHLAVVVPYGLLGGQVDPANGHKMYDRIKALQAHRAVIKWEMLAELLALIMWYAFCGYKQGFIKALWTQMSIYAVSSYLFSFFTLVTHLQEECFTSEKDRSKMSFAKRQVATCMDFAPSSLFWGLISGGLNTQALHHCVPSVSAMHLHKLYPTFKKVCKKHGVPLNVAPSLSKFVWGFVSFSY